MINRRCVLYIRDGVQSREFQLGLLTSFAHENRMAVEMIFYEDASGDTGTSFSSMLSYLNQRSDLDLVISRFDRLGEIGKSADALLNLVTVLASRNNRLVSLAEKFDSSLPFNRMVPAMMKGMAESKMTLKSERLSGALQSAISQGGPVGRPRQADGDQIYGLRLKGLKLREIAETTGLSVWTIQRTLKEFQA